MSFTKKKNFKTKTIQETVLRNTVDGRIVPYIDENHPHYDAYDDHMFEFFEDDAGREVRKPREPWDYHEISVEVPVDADDEEDEVEEVIAAEPEPEAEDEEPEDEVEEVSIAPMVQPAPPKPKRGRPAGSKNKKKKAA